MLICLCSARRRYVISDHRERLRHRTQSPVSDLASPTVDVLQKHRRDVQVQLCSTVVTLVLSSKSSKRCFLTEIEGVIVPPLLISQKWWLSQEFVFISTGAHEKEMVLKEKKRSYAMEYRITQLTQSFNHSQM
ncbi:GCN5-related N-acetyltransferase [Trichinella spiralis]|uniref:GCN5-related N-acetyltransferase n=1 Tax=Trichinella spiralis TaxID=6334 RepID=UPI0001EFB295|nr:GCN5-related N-acetyltransferase [Trichinella spiralis]